MKPVWIIILAVAAGHGVLVFGIFHAPALPKERYIAPPNFGFKEEVFSDPKRGETTYYREYRVSTKLSPAGKIAEEHAPAPH